MQHNNELKAYYLEIYKEMKKAESEAKKLVRSAMPFNEETQRLIRQTRNIRKRLHEIFSHPVFHQICSKCEGACCKAKSNCFLTWRDLVYAIAEDLNFELPYPDIEFLTSLKAPACIFLESKGCLLKEKRPIVCLASICKPDLHLGEQRLIGNGVLKQKEISQLATKLNQKTGLLFKQIFEQIKKEPRLFKGFGLDYVGE